MISNYIASGTTMSSRPPSCKYKTFSVISFGDESEMISSVGEFTILSLRTTVFGQSSCLTTYARSVWTLRSGISPSRELKAVKVSYTRVRLAHRISPLISPLTLSDIEPLQYESRCVICW
ncbi:hypothetical protein AVEN_9554-1 [Araneus ventricosus]|uniref:Uncharacterized protein n=1 Tax=Araneus ventricosus TaxID=182803 RepID=A0A4Y2JDX0_ARAVE|nr:hypothetical protein AVEN_9554-1 [Araneus ventricosus]